MYNIIYNYVLNIDKVFVCTNYCNNKVPYVSCKSIVIHIH